MGHYRLYCLDKQMHIIRQRHFDADDDASAIQVVRMEDIESDRELWEFHRKVVVIPAFADPPAP